MLDTMEDVHNLSFIDPSIAMDCLAQSIGKSGATSGILIDGDFLIPTTNKGEAIQLLKDHYESCENEQYNGPLECRLVEDLQDYLKGTWPNTSKHAII